MVIRVGAKGGEKERERERGIFTFSRSSKLAPGITGNFFRLNTRELVSFLPPVSYFSRSQALKEGRYQFSPCLRVIYELIGKGPRPMLVPDKESSLPPPFYLWVWWRKLFRWHRNFSALSRKKLISLEFFFQINESKLLQVESRLLQKKEVIAPTKPKAPLQRRRRRKTSKAFFSFALWRFLKKFSPGEALLSSFQSGRFFAPSIDAKPKQQ